MENRYKLTIDLKSKMITNNTLFKQGNAGTSVLEITLVDEGLPVNITGQTLQFNFLRSDNAVVSQDNTTGVTILDALTGKFECVLKAATLAVDGKVEAEIVFTEGVNVLSSTTFIFYVDASIGLLSIKYISSIVGALEGWQNTFLTSQNDRTITFNASEASRVSVFNAAEGLREAGEASRITAEDGRVSTFTINEAVRANTFLTSQNDRTITFNASEASRVSVFNAAEEIRDVSEDLREERFEVIQTAVDNVASTLSLGRDAIMPSTYVGVGNESFVPINLPSYNPDSDYFDVIYNGEFLTKDMEYTENENGLGVNLIGWTLDVDDIVVFRVHKTIVDSTSGAIAGSQIQAGGVSDIELSNVSGNIKERFSSYQAETASELASKAPQTDLDTQKSRIDLLVAAPNVSFYQKSTAGITGALLVVASGATAGQINLASVTPLATGYIPVAGDYVLLVYGVASGTAELIDAHVGADGVTYASAGEAIRGQVGTLQGEINETNDALPDYYPTVSYETVSNKRLGTDVSGNVVYIDADGISVVKFPVKSGRILSFDRGTKIGSSSIYRAMWCKGDTVSSVIENWSQMETGGLAINVPDDVDNFRGGTDTASLPSVNIVQEGYGTVIDDDTVKKCVLKSIKFTSDMFTDGKYIDASNGIVSEDLAYSLTQYISISGHLSNSYLHIKCWLAGNIGVLFYDKSKTFLSGIYGYNASNYNEPVNVTTYRNLPIPDNAEYIIVGISTNRKSLLLGTDISYMDFSYTLNLTKADNTSYFSSYKTGITFTHDFNVLDIMRLYANSLKFDQDLWDYRDKTQDYFSHDSSLNIDTNGVAYIVTCANTTSNGDNPFSTNAYVKLSIIDTSDITSSNYTTHTAAQYGDTVDGTPIASGCGVPNSVFVDSDTLRILFSAKLGNTWYMLYRDFTISTASLGSIGICKISNSGTLYDFTTDYINSNIVSLQSTAYFISMNAQIAKKDNVFYSGLGISNYIPNSLIFSSTDMVNYELWLNPSFAESNAMLEGACAVLGDYLYYALRQSSGYKILIAKINMINKSITQEIFIPDAMARASWLVENDKLYLFNTMDSRQRTNVSRIDTGDISQSKIIMQGSILCVYPSVVKYNNEYYITGTSFYAGGPSNVYIRKFTYLDNYGNNEIAAKFIKMLDNISYL